MVAIEILDWIWSFNLWSERLICDIPKKTCENLPLKQRSSKSEAGLPKEQVLWQLMKKNIAGWPFCDDILGQC